MHVPIMHNNAIMPTGILLCSAPQKPANPMVKRMEKKNYKSEIDLAGAKRLVEESILLWKDKFTAENDRLVIYGQKEIRWAWVIFVQSENYVVRGDKDAFLFGIGPCLIDKISGGVHWTGTGTNLRKLERRLGYRRWWDFWTKPRHLWEI